MSDQHLPAPDDDLPHCAHLLWDENGLPLSESFDDYYFSKLNGLAETDYIFLQHNQLRQRFATLKAHQSFVIGETGFGTGLNFLASWNLWNECAPADAQLHFISVEKYPLSHADLVRALLLWPELGESAQQLSQHYPEILHNGFHRLSFDEGRIHLTLIIADACDGLAQLQQSSHPAFATPQRGIDAWFLDGFSPAKNPHMWRPELFQRVHQLSAATATVATFAAATIVKRGLRENGFQIHTANGFGKKREMVHGELRREFEAAPLENFEHNSYNADFPVPWATATNVKTDSKSVVIVGAGIAGCHTARALARRGWSVTLLDQAPRLATAGSGNPQGVLYAKLSHRQETLSDFNLLALQYAQRHYQPYWRHQRALDEAAVSGTQSTSSSTHTQSIGQQCGVLQLAFNKKHQQLHQNLLDTYQNQQLFKGLDAQAASELSGVHCEQGGLFFPAAGWLNPASLCQQLINHPNIQVQYDTKVVALTPLSQGWQIDLESDQSRYQLTSPVVVLTNAHQSKDFDITRELPLKPIRGQVSYLNSSAETQQLKTVLCGDGYLPPSHDQQHCLGATFDPRNPSLEVTTEDHQRNLDTLAGQLPALAKSLTPENLSGGRAALRCTTPDYLPLVGPMPIYEDYLRDYALLRKNARSNIPLAGSHWTGLYLNVGHGSRGLAYTPICAEALAAQINREPSPLGQHLQTALHPGRFWIRDLIRGKR